MGNKIYVVVYEYLECDYEEHSIIAVTTDKTKAETICNKWNEKYETFEDNCNRTYCHCKEYEDGYLDEEFDIKEE